MAVSSSFVLNKARTSFVKEGCDMYKDEAQKTQWNIAAKEFVPKPSQEFNLIDCTKAIKEEESPKDTESVET